MKYQLSLLLLFALFSFKGDNSKTVIGSHDDLVNAVCYSPLGNFIASGSNDNKIKIWDANKKKLIKEITAHSVGVKDLIFTPNNKYLISAGLDNLVKVWSTENWKLHKTLSEHSMQVLALAISPNGKEFYSGGDDKKIIIWDAEKFEKITELEGHFDRVLSLNVSKNGKYLVSTGGDRVTTSPGNLKIWNLETRSMKFNLEEETYAIQDAALSSVGTLVLYAGNFSDAILLKWTENKVAAKTKVSDFGINTVELNGLQAYLGSTYNGEMISWKIGGALTSTKIHDKDINAISLSPDKQTLASTGADGAIFLTKVSQD